MADRYEPNYRSSRPSYEPRDHRDAYFDYPAQYDRYGGQRRSPPPPPPPYGGGRPDSSYDRYDSGYTFHGAASRDSFRPERPQDTFSFRAPGAPRFPSPDRYHPPPKHDNRRAPGQRGPRWRNDGARGRGGDRGRGGFRSRKPHTRDILNKVHGGSTPEQLHGMNTEGHVSFMELNSGDEENGEVDVVDLTQDSDDGGESRAKRIKTAASEAEPTVPKWSNPDPYTSLPPPDAAGGPKKDIVKVIRKAKVDAASKHDSGNAVKSNIDFISFDDDDEGSEDGEVSLVTDARQPLPPRYAPSAPASMRELPNHNQASLQIANGTANLHPQTSTSAGHRPRTRSMDDPVGPPPPPPYGLIMPTDEEIAANLVEQSKGKKRKRGEQQSVGVGSVLPEWVADGINAAPWYTTDHSTTSNAITRLHLEICDFFDFVRPHGYEEAVRRDLIVRVQQSIRHMHGDGGKDVEVRCFGSFAAGLYLPTADMDLVAVSPGYMNRGIKSYCQSGGKMHKLSRYLSNVGIAAPGTSTPITRAKVPIIKYVDQRTGIKVDISFENNTGLIANDTFQYWKVQYPAMPVLVVLIKQLVAMRGLNEVFTGGIGGFSIICLVVSMLELLPEASPPNPDCRYGHLLLTFLDFYGNKFNTFSTGIDMTNPIRYFDKMYDPMPKQNASGLTIADPNKPTNDISGGSRLIGDVFAVFRSAHAALAQHVAQIEAGQVFQGSMLECILGGNYSSFMHQRNKLSLLHRGHPVSPPPPSAMLLQPAAKDKAKAKKPAANAPQKAAQAPKVQTQPQQGPAPNVPGKPDQSLVHSKQPGAKHAKTRTKASKAVNKARLAHRRAKRAEKFKKNHPMFKGEIPAEMSHGDVTKLSKQVLPAETAAKKQQAAKAKAEKKAAKSAK